MSRKRWFRAVALLSSSLVAASLSGCRVLTIDEDRAMRARQGEAFDAVAFVGGVWDKRLLPDFAQRAVPGAQLVTATAGNLDQAGARFGRRAGEGSPWTFVTNGAGRVTAIDRTSRRGTVDVAVDGAPADRPVRLQVGPVVSGTAIRDAAGFLAFNDFTDQLAFADVGRALNDRALAVTGPAVRALRVGDRVRFTGALALAAPDDALLVTPVALERGANGAR